MYNLSEGVTQSMLSTFISCRQKSEYELSGWESAAPSTSPDVGNLFHRLCEVYYRHGKVDLKAEMKAWSATELKAGKDAQSLEGTLASVETIWPRYVKHYARSDAKMKCEDTELVFDVDHKDYGRLRGKIDGLFLLGKKRWMFETKTRSQINEDVTVDVLSFDFQNLFYLTALELMGRPTEGVIYNIVRNPGLKKAASLQELAQRVDADITERPDHYFKRFEVIYLKKDLISFRQELAAKTHAFREWQLKETPTYRNQMACVSRGYCPFIKACATGSMIGYSQTRKLFRELAAE